MATVQVCPCCGETFTAYPSARRIFCSMACKSANGKAPATAVVLEASRIGYCGQCGKVFRPTQGAPTGYCGQKCRHDARKAVALRYSATVAYVPKDYPEKPCLGCAVTFKPSKHTQKFCSELCRQGHRHRMGRARLAGPRFCACGVEVERKPGVPVCGGCRKDPRANQTEKERRRTLRKYGVDQAWFDATLDAQQHRCAICRTDEPGRKNWSIDHCHATGRVRGLLCNHCNTAIGLMRDDPAALRAAIDYLERAT